VQFPIIEKAPSRDGTFSLELRGIAPLSKRRIKLNLQVYFDLVFQIRVETEQNNLILSFELA